MRKNHKILVVDDDAKELELIEAILQPDGYDVVVINDSRLAIQTIKKEKPDLILLDIMMPELDGYTILNRLKHDELIKNIPVVIVTALGQDGPKIFAGICGASAYVTKPINSENLIKVVDKIIQDSTF